MREVWIKRVLKTVWWFMLVTLGYSIGAMHSWEVQKAAAEKYGVTYGGK